MLDLSGNRLEVLTNDSLAELASLRQVYLGENQLRAIEPYALANSSVQVTFFEIIYYNVN
jgi:Leucine-rich repeat (LRR) protein